MAQYRYRPKGNRTPLSHPVLGHLEYDGVYSHPDCAGHPDFKEIRPEPVPDVPPDSAEHETSESPTDAGDQPPVVKDTKADASAESAKPPAKRKADAGKPGRSHT